MTLKPLLLLTCMLSTVSAENCRSSADCGPGLSCIIVSSGARVCSSETTSSIIIDATLTPMKYRYCRKDDDCEGIGSKCMMYSWLGVCELSDITSIKTKYSSKHRFRLRNKKGFNEPCRRDDDCQPELMCVHRKRQSKCQISFRTPPSFECQSKSECPHNTICVYSKFYKKSICERKTSINRGIWVDKRLTEYLKNSEILDEKISENRNLETSSYSETKIPSDAKRLPISTDFDLTTSSHNDLQRTDADSERAVIKSVVEISSADSHLQQMTTTESSFENDSESVIAKADNSFVNHDLRKCTSNEQCLPDQECVTWIYENGKVVRKCTQKLLHSRNICLWNSDCHIDEICKKNESGVSVCQRFYSTSVERICAHDFECSGGWKCTNVGTSEQKRFRCRPPFQKNWSKEHYRSCRTDDDCPVGQYCTYLKPKWRCVTAVR